MQEKDNKRASSAEDALCIVKYVVIVAGGGGLRAGSEIPKQFIAFGGIPLLWRSVRTFHEEDPDVNIVLVLNKDYLPLWNELYSALPEKDREIGISVVTGGSNRLESVKNGLAVVPDREEVYVAVHDAARPFVSGDMIALGWKTAVKSGAAVPGVPVTDSLRILDAEGSRAVDRSRYVAVQTPQVFEARLLRQAYSSGLNSSMTDDASVVEAYGRKVTLFEGEPTNIKITNPVDLKIAEMLLG